MRALSGAVHITKVAAASRQLDAATRMFGSQGNQQAPNLFGVIGYLQAEARLKLSVAVKRRARGARQARHGSAGNAA
jgi:hypothetical protein